MYMKQVYRNQKSVEDRAGTSASVDENLIEIAKCVENADMYLSASRNYLNASKRAMKDLKDIMIHTETDINTAEDCIVESESSVLSLKRELQTIFSKTFYENVDHSTEAPEKNDRDDTSSGRMTNSKHPSLKEVCEYLQKKSEESNLDYTNYNITFEKYKGCMFVLMKSNLVDHQLSGPSNEAKKDSDTENGSPSDSLDNIQIEDGRRSKCGTECVSDDTCGSNYKSKLVVLPRISLKEKWAQTDFTYNWSENYPQNKTKCPIESSKENNQSSLSISQSFLEAKFADKQPLVPTENERLYSKNIIDMSNDFFSDELDPPVITSHAVNHLKKASNGDESLVNVWQDLEKLGPRRQNTVNDKQNSTSALNETLKGTFFNPNNRDGNTFTNDNVPKDSQTEFLKISSRSSSMKSSEFNNNTSTFGDNISNRRGSINMTYASNSKKNENIILKDKANISNCPINECCNPSVSIEDETLIFSGSTYEYGAFKYKRMNSVGTSTENSGTDNNTPSHSKTLFKSVSENNLIDFSPKPLSHSIKNMSCYLENGTSLMDEPLCPVTRESYEEPRKCPKEDSKQCPVKSIFSGSEANPKFSNKIIQNNEPLNRFKSIDSLALGDRYNSNKLRFCNSDHFLATPNKRLIRKSYTSSNICLKFPDLLNRKASSSNMQMNRTLSLPRVSREFKKPAEFVQILDEETCLSNASEDSLLSPRLHRSDSWENISESSFGKNVNYPKRHTKTVGTSTKSDFSSPNNHGENALDESVNHNLSHTQQPVSFPNCNTKPVGNSAVSNSGSWEGNSENLTAESFRHNLSDTQSLSFPNGDVFCGINTGASESIRVEVSDLSMNDMFSMNGEEYNALQTVLEEETHHGDSPRYSTKSSYSVSEMSLEEGNREARPTFQDISESGIGSQSWSHMLLTNCESRGRIHSQITQSFHPRSDSCSSPVPDYSP